MDKKVPVLRNPLSTPFQIAPARRLLRPLWAVVVVQPVGVLAGEVVLVVDLRGAVLHRNPCRGQVVSRHHVRVAATVAEQEVAEQEVAEQEAVEQEAVEQEAPDGKAEPLNQSEKSLIGHREVPGN